MKRGALLLTIVLLSLLSFQGYGQGCNSILSKANVIIPDQFCSPVQVDWEVTYVEAIDGWTNVDIRFNWNDGSSETISATEGPAGSFTADANHTYTSKDDKCNYHPVATLIVNGDVCESSNQEQVVTIWDTDNENGGEVNVEPDVYPVCVGNGATMQFDDGTLFNCVPPQENDLPNEDTRWIQWVYGTSNSMSSPTEVRVDGIVRVYPWEGPVITLTGPVHGSSEQSLPITVADDNLIGEEFEVELRYWNYCNPYLPGMPEEPAEIDRSVIRIVDIPDATITPVDTMCEFNNSIVLTVATIGGTFTGNGIINAATGEFAPYAAGSGTHKIKYEITDANACFSSDSIEIIVRDAPDGFITPVDPFCIYDAPYDLEAIPALGTWSGNGIINTNTGLFDPAVAGIGSHDIVFTTPVDAYGCSGIDSFEVRVADLPNAEFLTPDSAWCYQGNSQSTAEILITGSDTSRFDLIIDIRGTLDTFINLPADTFALLLNNQQGINEYVLKKIIEHHGSHSCDNDLNDTLIMEAYPQPEMTLTLDYDNWCSPVDVAFSAVEGYDSYFWDFGDGDISETNFPFTSHIYEYDYTDNEYIIEEGDTIYDLTRNDTVFPIHLIVTTDNGCYDEVFDSIRVYLNPIADFFVNPETQTYPDTVVNLINLTSPGIWSYNWDFADGIQDTIKDPNQHAYSTFGYLDIELTSFSLYCRDSIVKRILIKPPQPIAAFEPDSIGCPPLEISFRNFSKYADNYIWDFDDGYFSTEENPTHTFYQSKEHQVKLIALGLSGSDTTEQTVLIYERPQALFDAYPLEVKNLRQLIKFSNNSINASYYLWDLGDGNTSPDENPSHVYGAAGTYDITLYAWSEHDCPDTLIHEKMISVVAGEGSTKFPNAFVWNGSGPSGGHWTENVIDNTVFHPNLINAVELHMTIYNRWGEKLFESNEVYVGWDGYLQAGELASPGVYVYKAWVTYIDGEQKEYSGDVTFLH